MSKYHNRKTIRDGIVFDSKHEERRHAELELMEKAGIISNLQHQVTYELLPSQKGKLRNERGVKYIADFVYTENGRTIVEDAKGVKTKEYVMKRKLMKFIHDIEITEV